MKIKIASLASLIWSIADLLSGDFKQSLYRRIIFPFIVSSSVGQSFFDAVQYGLKKELSLSNISEAPLALPLKNEQASVTRKVENINNRFSLLSNSAYKQVELLKERRNAVIFAAVTGKIDLRSWQAPQSELTT